ncbi:DUF6429 family protein [Oceanispirochaeta sp. M1]|uniref:DUF6429 family protein n=1 Tax=Oceanispirochaeta sp. M1 TaxID=2283433 RepID=UPI000E0947ED|nr:DUF6429 family protein [Oceanispirochaeta sp. M1]NPD75306.1 hypothetical protein [Oceanispirochaeta sp. M1]RDG28830.1 hypothetical protein DV872_24735 [Oceanispirochaeta sp. M1]
MDKEKIDNAALALLSITLHDEFRAWKQLDWDILNRLYEKGFILDPVGKSKSVVFTEAGLLRAKELFDDLFSK